MAARTNPPFKFGFPDERMSFAGDYLCKFPGFGELAIHRDFTFVIYRLAGTNKVVRMPCDGLLHALGLIHNLLKEYDVPLPAEVKKLMEEEEDK